MLCMNHPEDTNHLHRLPNCALGDADEERAS